MEYRIYLLRNGNNCSRNKINSYNNLEEAKEALKKYLEALQTAKRINVLNCNEKLTLKLSKFFRTEIELLELEEIEEIEIN